MKILITATVIASALLIMPVSAGSCGEGNHAHLSKEMATKYFEQMDLNGDLSITKAEFENSPMAKMVKSFDLLQPNKSGLVEKDVFIKTFLEAHATPGKEV